MNRPDQRCRACNPASPDPVSFCTRHALELVNSAHTHPAAGRSRPYDWQLADDVERLRSLVPDELVERVRRLVRAVKADGFHMGVAVGTGPQLCITCGVPWPCKLSPHK